MKAVPVTELKGVGPKTAAVLAKIGIFTTADLIRHYPARFIRCPELSEVGEIRENETAAVLASPAAPLTVIRHGPLVMTQGKISDGSGVIDAVWYHMPYLKNSIRTSGTYVFLGRAVRKRGRFFLEQPRIYRPEEYEKIAGRLKPVYPLTAGIGNDSMCRMIAEALRITDISGDCFSPAMRGKYSLIPEEEAIRGIHDPGTDDDFLKCRRRIVFDEFFFFLYRMQRLKQESGSRESSFRMNTDRIREELAPAFPFRLTEGQEAAVTDILRDLSSGKIMNRLLQGDVGSGKTAVAVYALYTAFRNGCQSAIMAPTEVLSRQHFETLSRFFEPLQKRPRVVLLTGSMTKAEKKTACAAIGSHEADIVIGTHALIQDGVEFADLALVVTDELHRFGVTQREALAGKGRNPHMLVMSATPIPRTLAVILYGDLDISAIVMKPQGRLPVLNCTIAPRDRRKAYTHILAEIGKGHQAYVICPLVEEAEWSDEENVTDYAEKLRKIFGDRARIDFLHGKMTDRKKNEIMRRFVNHETDILVSTTVVEVGVDVPNATVMMIENADRFGLASLHQLRGRVGRGRDQSYCIFVNTSDAEKARERLDLVSHSNDGFEIAAEDLKMRGPGELFGMRQSGELTFALADIYNDSSVLKEAFDAVKTMSDSDPLQYDLSDGTLFL